LFSDLKKSSAFYLNFKQSLLLYLKFVFDGCIKNWKQFVYSKIVVLTEDFYCLHVHSMQMLAAGSSGTLVTITQHFKHLKRLMMTINGGNMERVRLVNK
jgi:hypothetical protein